LLAPPLLPVAAWAPSSSYKAGAVVSSGDSLYLCATAGTSATSAPASTGPGPIADNTVTWYYYRTIATPSGSAPAFTQSFTPDPTLTKRVFVPDNTSSFYFAGGNPTAIATPGWPGISEYIFPAVTISAGRQANHSASVTFYTNAAKFAVEDGSGTMFRMLVDGQYVTQSGLPDSGNRGYKELDFTNSGGSRTRKITFMSGGGWAFNAVRVGASDSVWAPASTADNIRLAVVGDSITAGGGTFPLLLDENWPNIVGMNLGWNDVWNQAVGGTGYISTVNGTAYNFGQRITDLVSSSPDLVIVFGGLNDSIYMPTQITSAALSYFQALRAGLPNTPIIVLGVYPAATGPSSPILNTEKAIHDAVTTFNDPLTYFVPIATDPAGSWLTGTGKVTAPNGTGNSDLYTSGDGTHPTESGLAYLGQRITQAVRAVLQQIP
jgi:lysophospholipase L1-like esterase